MQNQEKPQHEEAPASNQGAGWRLTRRFTMILLASWFLLSFCVLYFARELANMTFFGWPLSFYMAAQGLTLLYVAILGIFSLGSHRIARRNEPPGESDT